MAGSAARYAPVLVIQVIGLFFINLLIFFGPMLFFGLRQMKGYEPGRRGLGRPPPRRARPDRAQAGGHPGHHAVAVRRGVPQGRRQAERGLLFIGAPGTGKTMLSKAIATSFNSPIVTMPGSGFAQTFIGMDVIIVQFLIRKARKLAKKWGGQCIIFIDEIDAVGPAPRRTRRGAGRRAHIGPSPPSKTSRSTARGARRR